MWWPLRKKYEEYRLIFGIYEESYGTIGSRFECEDISLTHKFYEFKFIWDNIDFRDDIYYSANFK